MTFAAINRYELHENIFSEATFHMKSLIFKVLELFLLANFYFFFFSWIFTCCSSMKKPVGSDWLSKSSCEIQLETLAFSIYATIPSWIPTANKNQHFDSLINCSGLESKP